VLFLRRWFRGLLTCVSLAVTRLNSIHPLVCTHSSIPTLAQSDLESGADLERILGHSVLPIDCYNPACRDSVCGATAMDGGSSLFSMARTLLSRILLGLYY
jgi:hypothetical protein